MSDKPEVKQELQEPEIDKRTAAGRRIQTLLAERKQLRSSVQALQTQLAQAHAHNQQLLSDTRLGPAQIHRKAVEIAAHRQAYEDARQGFKRFIDFGNRVHDLLKGGKIPDGAQQVVVPHEIVRVLVEHPTGDRVAHHLITHPDVASELVAKPLPMAAADIGELAAKIDADSKREKAKSKAPSPVSPVGSGSAGSNYKQPGSMSFKEYAAARDRGQV